MASQSPHPVTSPVVQDVQSHATRQNQYTRWPFRNSKPNPGKRRVSVLAGVREYSQGGSSVASIIQGQNSTPSSSLNNSRIADITLSATQRQSIITTTTTPGTSSHNTPEPSGTSQTDSTHRVVSSPASGITSTPSPLSCLENLPTPIPNPEARAIITNPLRTPAAERNQRQRQWQLQTQVVSTHRSVVSVSRSIHRFGQADMTGLVFATGRLLERYMWNRWPFISAIDLETVSYATQCVVKAFTEAPHR